MKRATVALAFVVASMAQVVFADETEVNFVYMPAPDAETLVIEKFETV